MTAFRKISSLIKDNLAGQSRGIVSWCTAHPETLRAILRAHHGGDDPILIEATCNQVNQDGGYTGLTPKDFRRFVENLAREAEIQPERIMFGGDHLGPNPWKHLPAAEAMAKARAMVQAYVEAGFSKIHLDASMACAGDGALSDEEIAGRSADLCAVAEAARGGNALFYVIGTEVPIPGGETQELDTLAVTRPEAALRTFDVHAQIFEKRGLADAFRQVVGIVVQPGVDFGNNQVFGYDKAKAGALSRAIGAMPGIVFEAHSTDYQTSDALHDLVATHFAILKVGPELTFAYREAIFAMAAIEDRLNTAKRSGIVDAITNVMDADPRYWRAYVAKGADENLVKLYGLSDRVRYYWPNPAIAEAVAALTKVIDAASIPTGLLWQFAGPLSPEYAGLPLSTRIVQSKVGAVVKKYRDACR